MEIITIKKHGSGDAERDIYNGSPDAEFMEMCHNWDMNPPETWKNYDAGTEAGIKKIIEMEFRELMEGKTKTDIKMNIYHLSVALLRYWRILKK